MTNIETNTPKNILRGRVIGTSLYNFSMPLIRYELNDSIEINTNSPACTCGRGLPSCESIFGRTQDIITTTDGRFLSNVFILFDMLKGVLWCQIIQEKVNKIQVRLVQGKDFSKKDFEEFILQFRLLLGNGTKLEIEYLPESVMPELLSQKYQPIISNTFFQHHFDRNTKKTN